MGGIHPVQVKIKSVIVPLGDDTELHCNLKQLFSCCLFPVLPVFLSWLLAKMDAYSFCKVTHYYLKIRGVMFTSTLYKLDTSLTRTVEAGPDGVRLSLRESWLYTNANAIIWLAEPLHTISHYSSPLSSLVKTDHMVQSAEVTHQRKHSSIAKMKRIYCSKRARELFFRLKTAVSYSTVKRQAGAEVSRFDVSSLEGFFFRSQQLTYKIVYTCIGVISSEEELQQKIWNT